MCPNCGADFEGPTCRNCDTTEADDPTRRPDGPWVCVYSGEAKWQLLIRRALESGRISSRVRENRPEPIEPAYGFPAGSADVLVRQPDEARALEILADLKEKIPDAFPEGTL